MIDLHFHVLPGIDDGPETLEESVMLARAAETLGTKTIVATPHIDYRHEVDPLEVPARVAQLNVALGDAGLELRVIAGGELGLGRADELSDDELTAVRLGWGRHLLLEAAPTATMASLEYTVLRLQARGHGILLAHPERCALFQHDPFALGRLVDRGVLCQLTSASFAGRFGSPARRSAIELLRLGLAHVVASDAHSVARRTPNIAAGLAAGEEELPGLGALSDLLCREVPAAILAGTEVPPVPSLQPARGSRRARLFARKRSVTA